MNEENFEKEFPSLQKIYNEWICEEDSGFYPDEIQKHCLDKQRVKEAIKNLRNWIETHEGFRPYSEGFKRFEKELGLE